MSYSTHPIIAAPVDVKQRVASIDLLRGVVMVIMALDHVRDYFHSDAFYHDPTDLATTTPVLFFTRWITHFCAPAFVFLAGTSAFLAGSKGMTTKALSLFLLTRGIWLVLLEVTVVSFAWRFDVQFSMVYLQVIWAIGMSMILLSAMIWLPLKITLATGLVIVLGHNLLDSVSFEPGTLLFVLWSVVHQTNYIPVNDDFAIMLIYPVLPWFGLMCVGYAFGSIYQPDFSVEKRKALLLNLGFGMIVLFILLRSFNVYGDSSPWSMQNNFTYSLLSFINTSKYPPSLLFLLMTIGPALLFLRLTEKAKGRVADFFITFGRVPFFYYILHLYLIHSLAMLAAAATGFGWTFLIHRGTGNPFEQFQGYGFNLALVYLVWLLVIIILYPLCYYYCQYKARHKEKWWLSYL